VICAAAEADVARQRTALGLETFPRQADRQRRTTAASHGESTPAPASPPCENMEKRRQRPRPCRTPETATITVRSPHVLALIPSAPSSRWTPSADGRSPRSPTAPSSSAPMPLPFVDELPAPSMRVGQASSKPFCWQKPCGLSRFRPLLSPERYQLKVAFVVESPELKSTPADPGSASASWSSRPKRNDPAQRAQEGRNP